MNSSWIFEKESLGDRVMCIAGEIIDYCTENRVSSTEVADAMGKNGVFPKVGPINRSKYRVGPVKVVFAANNSNYSLHEQIRDVKKGEVVIVFAYKCDERALLGDLISKYTLLYKGAAAIVVQGMVRDAASLYREDYALWAEGVTPLGCFNEEADPYPSEMERHIRDNYEAGIAICDDGGVTVIPPNMLDESMLTRLKRVELQEDIWFFCLDTLKWDTKEIVCDKAYLTDQQVLSKRHIEQLKDLSTELQRSKE